MEGLGGPVDLERYSIGGIDPSLEDCCRREVCDIVWILFKNSKLLLRYRVCMLFFFLFFQFKFKSNQHLSSNSYYYCKYRR